MADKAGAAAVTVSVGETVSGTVEHITPYGAFIRLETGQKAMVHISELSHNYVKKVEDVLELGKKVTAKIIKIDDKGRIDLSIKALQVKEVRPPVHREEDFEKKLNNFLKFSDEKIADLNSKNKEARGSKRRSGNAPSGKR
ncbi:MAG: S1 RNA-binding domain-containing protein [Synergistes sp.]|nr:S1 RNA-binding domain-containing protein [Synergistes sp.]